jgi:xanthine/uracil/vitamin C permease (AzgA family)
MAKTRRPVLQNKGLIMQFLERYFKLKDNGTTVRTELLAGLTTFLTMAYIIFVNPSILGDAGMPKDPSSSPPAWRPPSAR